MSALRLLLLTYAFLSPCYSFSVTFRLFAQHVCEADDRDEVVVCELCEANVANFNAHMKKSHPGCGRSANRQGYRSNGSYVDGWFGGECGSGNPYYLLCGSCREKYLAIKSKAKVPIVERYGAIFVVANVSAILRWSEWLKLK